MAESETSERNEAESKAVTSLFASFQEYLSSDQEIREVGWEYSALVELEYHVEPKLFFEIAPHVALQQYTCFKISSP